MAIISGTLPPRSRTFESGFGSDVESISTSITANWSWNNKLLGLVSWNFKNNSMFQETAVLYRSGYYFGNAYFPIYIANGVTNWATRLTPLMNRGTDRNSMPTGVVDFGDGKRIIAFLFTLDPGQTWSVLEGGFNTASSPSNAVVYGVSLEKQGSFCIGYDPQQVTDYDKQTSSNLKGYSPNPTGVRTIEVSIVSFAPFVQIFSKDNISDGMCSGQPETILEASGENSPGDIEEIIGGIINKVRSF